MEYIDDGYVDDENEIFTFFTNSNTSTYEARLKLEKYVENFRYSEQDWNMSAPEYLINLLNKNRTFYKIFMRHIDYTQEATLENIDDIAKLQIKQYHFMLRLKKIEKELKKEETHEKKFEKKRELFEKTLREMKLTEETLLVKSRYFPEEKTFLAFSMSSPESPINQKPPSDCKQSV